MCCYGGRKNSVFTYMVSKANNILNFESDTLPLIPRRESSKDDAHYDKMDYGMFIKLFDYQIPRFQSSIVGNLMFRLSQLLPNLPYPIRLVECRDYESKGLSGTLTGLMTRLTREKADGDLEEGFPLSSVITVESQEIRLAIYAFKDTVEMKK